MGFPTYPLPEFLKGVWTKLYYGRWLSRKANEARRHDHERKSPFAARYSQKEYRHLIHDAMLAGNGIDPFTGEPLRFDLEPAYDFQKARGNIAYEKSFDLMPTVDHIDPDADKLALEICSWRMNFCKSYQNPADFIATCRKIVEYQRIHPLSFILHPFPESPKRWFLPPYLEGRCTLEQFRRWIFSHAATLLSGDRKLGRPWALDACMGLYKQIIYAAAQNAIYDPFTGELLQWELINKWNPRKKDPSAHSVKKFRLLPTADHVDPASDVLDIQICSWFMNGCKGNLNPSEFVAICGKVADYAAALRRTRRGARTP
jgi:hypothetical protein